LNPLKLDVNTSIQGSFFVKPIRPIEPVAIRLIPEGQEHVERAERTRMQIVKWLQDHPKSVMWGKGKQLVPFEAQGVKTKTGFDLVGDKI